ncbi:hypothetical protein CDAR_311711 [Caerostris darwini]|uniref:Uncharacterized protein n=1 Tax=Caerostris darwini TaxID=1538125 RepID=A0AAV4TIK6_9ARAC|nr:hypothetical protein CDAR_311711 [Caerostris darwini]
MGTQCKHNTYRSNGPWPYKTQARRRICAQSIDHQRTLSNSQTKKLLNIPSAKGSNMDTQYKKKSNGPWSYKTQARRRICAQSIDHQLTLSHSQTKTTQDPFSQRVVLPEITRNTASSLPEEKTVP